MNAVGLRKHTFPDFPDHIFTYHTSSAYKVGSRRMNGFRVADELLHEVFRKIGCVFYKLAKSYFIHSQRTERRPSASGSFQIYLRLIVLRLA